MLFAVLAGCAAGDSPMSRVLADMVSGKLGAGGSDRIPLQPDLKYRYLRVEVEGRPPAMLVLAYLDPDPLGEIEVWVSASNEVIRLQQGRIVGTAGLDVDWRSVNYKPSPPFWPAMRSSGASYERVRDQMPGYKHAISEHLELERWPGVPPITLPVVVSGTKALAWTWYREAESHGGASALPAAWFAWGKHRGQDTVVYTEQCLSSSFCLKLLRWPVLD